VKLNKQESSTVSRIVKKHRMYFAVSIYAYLLLRGEVSASTSGLVLLSTRFKPAQPVREKPHRTASSRAVGHSVPRLCNNGSGRLYPRRLTKSSQTGIAAKPGANQLTTMRPFVYAFVPNCPTLLSTKLNLAKTSLPFDNLGILASGIIIAFSEIPQVHYMQG
jgi:hypothetical protein